MDYGFKDYSNCNNNKNLVDSYLLLLNKFYNRSSRIYFKTCLLFAKNITNKIIIGA